MSEVFSHSSFLVESKLKHWASVCISVHLSTRKLRHLQSLITTKAVCCKYDETELYLWVAEKPNWLKPDEVTKAVWAKKNPERWKVRETGKLVCCFGPPHSSLQQHVFIVCSTAVIIVHVLTIYSLTGTLKFSSCANCNEKRKNLTHSSRFERLSLSFSDPTERASPAADPDHLYSCIFQITNI